MPVYELLSADMERVKARAPSSFKKQVDDAERRLNLLFDHLNNEDLLKPNTINDMATLANALQSRDYETAQAIHVDIMTHRIDECGNWMVRPCPFCFTPGIMADILTLNEIGRRQASDQHEPCYPVILSVRVIAVLSERKRGCAVCVDG